MSLFDINQYRPLNSGGKDSGEGIGGGSGSGGPNRQDWEPENSLEWENWDRLGPSSEAGIKVSRRGAYDAEQLYSAWNRLSPWWRAQAWREREIAAELYELAATEWKERPYLEAIGVARRTGEQINKMYRGQQLAYGGSLVKPATGTTGNEIPFESPPGESPPIGDVLWSSSRLLCGVIFVRPTVPSLESVIEALKIPILVQLSSRISPLKSYSLSEYVPLIVETSHDYIQYATGAQPTAKVATYLESGSRLDGQIASGYPQLGTLAGFGWSPGHVELLAVTARHIVGDAPNDVYHEGKVVARVIEADAYLDAALLEITDPNLQPQKLISGLGVEPGMPVFPVAGMPGQFVGAVSGAQQGQSIDTTYRQTPGGFQLGNAPSFEMQANAQHGDSGALVLTGHGMNAPVDPLVAQQNPTLSSLYTAAIVGMVIAGPAPIYPPNQTRRVVARPAVDIGSHFQLNWWTR